MHSLSAWFTRNPVAANLLMLIVVIAGVFTLYSIRIEGFPALPPSSVSVTTIYAGATAEQVDNGLSRPIEKAMEGMAGVKKISSLSAEGISTVWLQKTSGFDLDRFQNEIQSRLNGMDNIPRMAERPLVTRDEFNIEALLIQLYGNVDRKTMQKVARDLKSSLLAHPKITRLTPFGLLNYEVRIEVDDEKMRSYGLSLSEVAEAIERSSLDYRTGSLKSESGRVTIKADLRVFDYCEFRAIPIRTLSDGSRLTISDVANVIDGFEEEDGFARFQGESSVGMLVYTSKKGHLIEVSEAAHEVVEKFKSQLPEGLEVDVWGESSTYMKARLNLLADNALQGLLIVFLLLALFLNIKLAFWVAMGIPISIAGTLMIMGDRFLGYSLNDITTFGMIVVLGILVDDAIVVGESVFESRGKIKDPVKGTIEGVKRVSTATIFGCFTTVAAFYPLLLIDNDIGKIFASFSVVVIVALIVSLLESKLILPAHLAGIRTQSEKTGNALVRAGRKLQCCCQKSLDYLNTRVYQPLLRHVLHHRYSSLVVFFIFAFCGIMMLFNGTVRTVFFPEVPGQIITVNMKMKGGSPLSLAVDNVHRIEQAAEAVNSRSVEERGGEPPIAKLMVALVDSQTAEIYAELLPEEKRPIETMEILRQWREKTGSLEGVEELSFVGSFDTAGGFVLELQASDSAVLSDAVNLFTSKLSRLDGVHDVRDDLAYGDPQILLQLKPEAQHLGLSAVDLASQIGDAFGGLEVQRMQRGQDEVRVFVKYQSQRRRYIRDLLDTWVQASSGKWIPLSLVATINTGYLPSTVYRNNGQRVVQIKAALDKDIISPSEAYSWIQQNIMPELVSAYPALELKGAGELEEIGEIKGGLIRALVMIFILIYALLAVPLKSYWQPLVIMAVIPFGFVGAMIGHAVMGYPLSILSFFGMLAAMGVVVNDSLVMLTRYNEIRNEGQPVQVALIQAGASRFRAIILTTVTTTCGLMPLLFESSEQAQYLIPAAISLAWGELMATPITLMLIPVLTSISNDIRATLAPHSLMQSGTEQSG